MILQEIIISIYLSQILPKSTFWLNPSLCTGLCTAASMENVSIKSLSFEDLTVTAIVTGGIEHNAGRAGDDATFCEKSGKFYPIEPGTINIILHIFDWLN